MPNLDASVLATGGKTVELNTGALPVETKVSVTLWMEKVLASLVSAAASVVLFCKWAGLRDSYAVFDSCLSVQGRCAPHIGL